ncbi:MAG: CYTH domain-containing protein [Proteobacteria bacterium]|nr:CYTH domain-containing protein [Pseudomonadota bacterium]
MGKEIERKFLVVNDDWRNQVSHTANYAQGYLNEPVSCSVRVRIEDDQARLNIKRVQIGMSRDEFEYPIPLPDAHKLMTMVLGPTVVKTRHFVMIDNHEWEIDEFHGDNQGLVVAELELDSEHEHFDVPAWVGKEVTDEARYYNVFLSQHPFSQWTDEEKWAHTH